MNILRLLLFLFLTVLLLVPHADASKPVILKCSPNFAQAGRLFANLLRRNPSLAAAFVRASFHDCITTHNRRKHSGCNGSLRLRSELQFGKNHGLDILMGKMEPIVRKTCISYADAIQIGVEASMLLSGGLHMRLGRNRVDAVLPDPIHTELPGLWDFNRLVKFYARKGFGVQELVVSLVGGHSLGQFFGLNFSPNPNKFDTSYAMNLWHLFIHKKSLPGFNTLSSDRALFSTKEGQRWVRHYGEAGIPGGSRASFLRLASDFKKYLHKLSHLHVHA